MKKDKSVRKAEFKAALKKQLKALIGPGILCLIILAGILVVMFYKGEEVVPEPIKLNGFEGEEKEFVLENDQLKLVMDAETTQFTLTVKKTGEVWTSNPENPDADAIALKAEKDKLKSTLLLTYSNKSGVDLMYDNYKFSVENKIFDYEVTEDAIRINYSLGDVEKEYVFPPVMTKERYDAYMEQFDGNGKNVLSSYFKKYDINKLGKKDNKEELLAQYPLLETNVIYVLRDTTKDAVKKKLQLMFEEIGYTYEEYLEDKAQDKSEKTSDKPVYNVSMIYRLDGSDLIVEIPYDSIEYQEEFPIYQLTLLPYFGAAGTEDTGYMFVPEGGGAIINNNNGKLQQNGYYANVYGWDRASDRYGVTHETRTAYNVFGAARENSSYLCVIEQGAPYASIQADISGKLHNYNYVNAVYTILKRDEYQVSDRADGSLYVYQPELPKGESITQRYRFVDSGSYVDMAENYHDYLMEKYPDELVMNDDTETPVLVDILGAVDKIEQVLGVPVSRPLALTTIKEAGEVIAELHSEGLNNMSVKLTGFFNGGVQQEMLNRFKVVSRLGKEKELKQMIQNAADLGVPVYLDGITDYAINSNLFDGFTTFSDAARFTNKEHAKLYHFSTVMYAKMFYEGYYYLLKEPVILEMMDNLADAAEETGAQISFQNTGYELSGDYTKKDSFSRQKAMNDQAAKLKELGAKRDIMINMGNDYAVPYADFVTNMDLSGSGYTIIDRQIPFYQLAVHGYVNYTGEALNLTENYENELLKSAEYGAGLAFSVMQETPFTLQNTVYYEYFGSEYASCHDKMVEVYNRYNKELGHTFNQRMTNHEYLNPELACTTYEDGTKVYVNYSYNYDADVNGVVIPARDYVVVK